MAHGETRRPTPAPGREREYSRLRGRAVRGGDVLKGRLCSDFVYFASIVIFHILQINLTLCVLYYVFRHYSFFKLHIKASIGHFKLIDYFAILSFWIFD